MEDGSAWGQGPALAPHHSQIRDLRRVPLEALAILFVQMLRLCLMAGLASLITMAIDATSVNTTASNP